ncbi:MAG: hypothetical protein M0R77_19905 [Gammaproteobacteria bacterium]|nr:hypothetical protein [Gammaproteobacteria bacterium]
MKIEFQTRAKNRWVVIVDGKRSGAMNLYPANKEEPRTLTFKDYSSKVQGVREGLTRKEFEEIIENFYKRKQRSVGTIMVQDLDEFIKALKEQRIFNYFNENNIFFFYDELSLTAARILV